VTRIRKASAYLIVAAFALAAGVIFQLETRHRAASESAPAPTSVQLSSVNLPDLTGRAQALDQWRGRVLVVNFWATWCAPCRKEVPELIHAQSEWGQRGLQIVGIAIDEVENVKPYAADMGINYPVLIGGPEGLELARGAGDSLAVLPFTVVVDRSGKAVSTQLGGVDRKKLAALIEPLL